MVSQGTSYSVLELETGDPTPPSFCGWWSRPIATYPRRNVREPTFKEEAALFSPCCGGLLTVLAIFVTFLIIDKTQPHAKFSIKSIVVSPSTATWHVDFLVKNPSSRYSINYDGDDASVKLGTLNAAVLNNSHISISRDHTVFSLAFVTEGNQNDVVSQELDITLSAKHKRYTNIDEAGNINIKCQNLTRSHDNIEKIKCKSSLKPLSPKLEF